MVSVATHEGERSSPISLCIKITNSFSFNINCIGGMFFFTNCLFSFMFSDSFYILRLLFWFTNCIYDGLQYKRREVFFFFYMFVGLWPFVERHLTYCWVFVW